MKIVFQFLAILLVTSTFAQKNLVPNASFEAYSAASSQWSNSKDEFNERIERWFSPTEGSPDIYLNNQSTDWMYNAQGLGLDDTKFGKAMVGITTFVPNYSTKVHKREYVSIQLNQTLQTDRRYRLEFWLKNPKKALASSHLGVLFTQNSFYVKTERVVNAVPQFEIDTILHASQWTKITYEFTPMENFDYLTIGSFAPKDSIDYTSQVKRPSQFAYYYIDEISLVEVEKVETTIKDFVIGEQFSLKNIHFEYDKAVLMSSSFPELNKLFDYLNNHPAYTLDIFGHTDHDGSEKYNLTLSKARAKAVAQFLMAKGIEGSRLSYEGFGESKPIAENLSEYGKQLNRRVEFIIHE